MFMYMNGWEDEWYVFLRSNGNFQTSSWGKSDKTIFLKQKRCSVSEGGTNECPSLSFQYIESEGRLLFLRFYLFLEGREGKGRRKGEKHQCVVASCAPPTGDLVCNPGMCPDWESNQWPIGSQASTQSTGPHQPELSILDKKSVPQMGACMRMCVK